MSWTRLETPDWYEEWERSDGLATLRLRERADGGYVLRLDRLEQAPDGPAYRRELIDDRDDAEALLAEWKTRFDLPAGLADD